MVREDTTNQDQVGVAVKMLWSADERERDAGKDLLIRLGPNAIEPLVLLLEGLLNNEGPRFPTGKEKEGTKALDRYLRLVRAEKGGDESREARSELFALTLNSRLMTDTIELLGRLKAIEAVPLLLRIMEGSRLNLVNGTSKERMGIEMEALCRIGPPAVPQLIEEIEHAHLKAANLEFVTFGCSIVIGRADNPTRSNEISTKRSMVPDEDERAEIGEIRIRAYRIRVRAAMVLGSIGDARALPILEKLLNETQDEFLIDDLKEAIERIRKKN